MENKVNCKAGNIEKITKRGIAVEHIILGGAIFLGWVYIVRELSKVNTGYWDYFGMLVLTVGAAAFLEFLNYCLYGWRVGEC